MPTFPQLLKDLRACTICKEHLPLGPKPIFQLHASAKILIAGQAPGVRAHESGIPWNDPSGKRLREWLGVSDEEFYDAKNFALLPAGFCYPGTGKSGDLPPRPECRQTWHDDIMQKLTRLELIVLAGIYSQEWMLADRRKDNLTDTVRAWKTYLKTKPTPMIPLPHPSPRNQLWMKKQPWFAEDVLPALKKRVRKILRC